MHTNQKGSDKWLVYYDGLCMLCSREIAHYRGLPGSENIQFIDITTADFDAQKEGLDPFKVHKVMHVRRPSGDLLTAVDAFIEIWTVIPQYNIAAALAKISVVKPVLTIGYHAFAKIRPYLPKVKRDCEQSPYCEINTKTSEIKK